MVHDPAQRVRRLPTRRSLLESALAMAAGGMVTSCASAGQATAPLAADGSTIVRYPGWPSSVLHVELAEDLGYLDGVSLQGVGSTTSGPQDIQAVATASSDIGYAFTGAVIKLAEAGADIQAISLEYGSDATRFDALMTGEDREIHTQRDLIGKTVAMNALGAHAEAYVSTWLRTGGLSEEEIASVTLVAVPPNDIAQNILRGHIDCGCLSGIAQDVALTQGGIREVMRDTDLFGHFAAGESAVRRSWAEANPEATTIVATGMDRAIRWAADRPRDEVIDRLQSIVARRDRNEKTEPLTHYKGPGLGSGGLMSDTDFTRWEPWLNATRIVDGPVTPGDYYTNDYIRNDTAAAITPAPATSLSGAPS